MLGFKRLSNLAIHLEEACNADRHIDERTCEIAQAGLAAKRKLEDCYSTQKSGSDKLRKQRGSAIRIPGPFLVKDD